MIEIINNNGTSLELDEDFVLTIERTNPLFNQNNDFFQDISYPGKTGLTENNKVFISSGQLLEVSIYRYELPVSVLIDGATFFNGTFTYDIQGDQISFFLKIGYGVLAEKSENTLLTDVNYGPSWNVQFEDKQNTLVNPDSWPFAYFPVYHNTHKAEEVGHIGEPIEYFVNPYDYANQIKYEWTRDDPSPWRDSSHFKLVYILEKAFNHIGLKTSGSFFTSDKTKYLYIFNERFTGYSRIKANDALPFISITDLLKALKERFRIPITFDLKLGKVTIEEPNALLRANEVVDISQYISAIEKIHRPDRKTYKIQARKGEDEFNPPNYISVVDPNAPGLLPEEKIEISISSLPSVQDATNNYYYPTTSLPFLTGGPIGGPSPEANPNDKNRKTALPENTSFRLLKYAGLKQVTGSMDFPTAESVEFGIDDGEWYAFLNDSKLVQLKAYIPTYILPSIDPYKKIGFISQEGVYLTGLIKSLNYSLSNSAKELVETTIEVYIRTEKLSRIELTDNPIESIEEPGTRPPRE